MNTSPISTPVINSVAVIGNYLPRKCGIATFTADIVKSLTKHNEEPECKTIAINDRPGGYDYPEEVCFEINENDPQDYRTAAEYININQFDMVSLQHEFGIYGGDHGQFILELLEDLTMPVVTTLHTVLVEPTREQAWVMNRLIELSDRLVVMSDTAVNILHTIYDIPREDITLIPHGIPDVPFVDPCYYKEKFDLIDRKVLLTFGLLSQNKGIEYVIKALPDVVEKVPDLTYIVLGATHPNILEAEGEQYRNKLKKLVRKLDLEDHVKFENRFVPFDELCEYLSAADLYITPYTKEEQITSGTLAYALGTGKAVISTPYWYAKEMLSDGRGQLVPFEDAPAITDAMLELFEDDAQRHQMRKKAYDDNREARWEEVANQYIASFKEVRLEHRQNPQPSFPAPATANSIDDIELPPLAFDHLLSLTDDTGILQHARYTIANRDHGYCTDDNARALIMAMQALHTPGVNRIDKPRLNTLAARYLSFLLHAYNPDNGRFRNFMSYSRQWLESSGSEDSHGRALWALGETIKFSKNDSYTSLASSLFMKAVKAADSFEGVRPISFALVGMDAYLETFAGDSNVQNIGSDLAERLLNEFRENQEKNWPWLESTISYSNGKVPDALITWGQRLDNPEMVRTGLRALEWLLNQQTEDGHISIIGNEGWFVKDKHKARFDQQALELHALIEACITAYNASNKEDWLERATQCFNWFLGHNDLHMPLYDSTGGCRDGLESTKVNQNQGAESTLAWLLSLLTMYRVTKESKEDSEVGSMEKSLISKR
ncbi:glycosyltransferase family 4 protein [Fodinibius sediminis]|uniref:Glycosyltransferase involved in cell wall bisynthesis n=1 Tax=Fodinibius sediminis TaxID=1214077 RepID=A0A521BDA8_9BACT|nr:glycosyltransferase family 4 protein [Fodinibius sediminis]SMO45088.1 Glycosyltransferase involved in cell wall bisynthesis [Fodinibius sediminis]